MALLIAPHTCESTSTQVRVAARSRTKVWAIHQPGSLGDVQYFSFICMKTCELSFVDIGVHRKRLIAIPVLRWAGQQISFSSITCKFGLSLLIILITFQAWEVIF